MNDLRGVAESMLALRAQVKEPMKEFAARDSESCEISDIGQTLVDLHNHRIKMDDRLKKALDKEAVALDEKVKELQADVAAKQEYIQRQAEANASVIEVMNVTQVASAERINNLCDQNDHLNEELDSLKALGVQTLGKLLLRWKPFLEIYGEEVYNLAKAAFVAYGGDVKSLPMPEPEPKE